MRALEKSTGKTAAELEKMMEQGQLTTEYIKPLVMALGDLASANGAYEKALRKLGTVENRMKTSAGLAAGRIAEAGFTKGLINLYETLMKAMNDNGKSLDRLGKIYEKVFNAIASLIDNVVVPVLSLFLRTIESVYKAIQWGIDNPIGGMIIAVGALGGAFRAVVPIISSAVMVMMKVLKGPMGVIMALMGAIDEIRGVFDENVIGLGENEKASPEDRKIAAANARVYSGFGTTADKKLLSGLSSERINQAKANSGGAAAYMGIGGQGNLLTTFPAFKALDAAAPDIGTTGGSQYFMSRLAKGVTGMTSAASVSALKSVGAAKLNNSLGNVVFDQKIIVQGNVTEDNVQQIKEQTKKVMDDYSNLNSAGSY